MLVFLPFEQETMPRQLDAYPTRFFVLGWFRRCQAPTSRDELVPVLSQDAINITKQALSEAVPQAVSMAQGDGAGGTSGYWYEML